MIAYPSTSKQVQYGKRVYCFDKLDGSNIRAEWNKKSGFHKFGSRGGLIGEDHLELGESISLIKQTYEETLSRIFAKNSFDFSSKITAFFEFFGPNSFAGVHQKELHEVVLFDIYLNDKDRMLDVRSFLKFFDGKVKTPAIVYSGAVNKEIEDEIKNSKLPGITFEGVMCKPTMSGSEKIPDMFKIKTNAWLEKLKGYCKDNESLYKELE